MRLHTKTLRADEAITTSARSGTRRVAITDVKSDPGPMTIWSADAIASSARRLAAASGGSRLSCSILPLVLVILL